ncbi:MULTISPECIES: GAP family protein [unclassified Microbacterium]|uniref:GAP family protein n=1 Tax=unclassified Microbacterium TaxID=2609290 RepID=UPI00301756D3
MNQLHDLLPLAVGMLLSPLPIVAIVAIVLAPRGRAAAPVYTLAFTAVSLVFIVVGALSSAAASSASPTGTARTVSFVLAIVLALGFTVLAVASWLSRPQHGQQPKAPSWLAAIDTVTPAKAAALGLVMALTNTKNIPLALKGGALIGEAHLPLIAAVGLCLALAVAGSLLLILPTAVATGGSPRVAAALRRLKTEMITHNAAMMTVLFAILAANEAAQVLHHLVSSSS